MRTKTHDWLDLATKTVWYSFQVLDPRDKGWNNVVENGKPLMFRDKAERDLKQAEYRKKKWPEGMT